MNIRHVMWFLLAVTIATVLAFGPRLGWPIWLWFLLPTLCAGVLLVDLRLPRSGGGRGGRDVNADSFEEEIPAEGPYQETSVVVVPIESAVADCPFLFSATVWWRLVEASAASRHANPSGLAVTALLRRVRSVAAVEHPSRHTLLEHEMEGYLGIPMPDDTGLVTAYATDIRLVLRRRDQDYLEEQDQLRKDMSAWEGRRRHERNVREYLGEDVLQSPGSAVVWWMARHDDEIERAVQMIAPLTVLSAAANNEEIPEAYSDLLGARGSTVPEEPRDGFDHPEPVGAESTLTDRDGRGGAAPQPEAGHRLSAWLDELGITDRSERAAFLHRLVRVSEAAGRTDAAESIRSYLRGARPEAGGPPGGAGGQGGDGTGSAPASDANMPPGSEHRADGASPRTSDWQVTTEGLVSEAEQTTWPTAGTPRPEEGSGPDRTGSQW